MPYIFVVDRDRPDLFEYMRADCADDPEIGVMLDRRRGDRRRQESAGTADRRRGDRRGVPADTWTTLGFVTVQTPVHAASERVLA
jgi:hypothetical protein